MTKPKWIKMSPTLALWDIIDRFGVKGYIQTAGYLVLVPNAEYERVVRESADKPKILKCIDRLTKKEIKKF